MPMYHVDAASGAAASRVDDNGYFRSSGVIAKVGVYEYVNADGSIRTEFVPPETLADAAANLTLSGVPVTVGHPQEGVVSSHTAALYSKGAVVSTPYFDGDELKGEVSITHADAINRMDQQKIYFLSPGYHCKVDYKPGVYKGKHYDFVQTKRVYNHLAVVTDARGGEDCKLRLDSADFVIAVGIDHVYNDSLRSKPMPTVTLPNGATVTVEDASTANAIATAFRTDADDKAKLKMDLDDAIKKVDELQGKYDALEEEAKKDEDDEAKKADEKDEEVANRADSLLTLLDSARTLKTDINIRADGGKLKSQRDIMCEALGNTFEGKTDDYVLARFDAACDLSKSASSNRRVGEQRRVDGKGEPVLSANERHRAAFLKGEA